MFPLCAIFWRASQEVECFQDFTQELSICIIRALECTGLIQAMLGPGSSMAQFQKMVSERWRENGH